MLNFVKGFLCIYWDNHMVFIFQFVNVVYYIDSTPSYGKAQTNFLANSISL